MCFTLYAAADGKLREIPWNEKRPGFFVQPADEQELEDLVDCFSKPYVYYLGPHTQCGCGFASVVPEETVESWKDALAAQHGAILRLQRSKEAENTPKSISETDMLIPELREQAGNEEGEAEMRESMKRLSDYLVEAVRDHGPIEVYAGNSCAEFDGEISPAIIANESFFFLDSSFLLVR